MNCSGDKEWHSTRVQEAITDQAMLYLLIKRLSRSDDSLEDFGGQGHMSKIDLACVWMQNPNCLM